MSTLIKILVTAILSTLLCSCSLISDTTGKVPHEHKAALAGSSHQGNNGPNNNLRHSWKISKTHNVMKISSIKIPASPHYSDSVFERITRG